MQNKRKPLSVEHKKKISKSSIGRIAWNKGKKGYKVNVSPEGKAKMLKAHKGIKLSQKTKDKISKARLTRKMPSQLGELNPNWKGGITPENIKIRQSIESKLWRKSCMERDNFTCQITKEHGGKLVVHHINNFADFPELRLDISNGITLSYEIHRIFHTKYGIRNNTREQLKEFIKNYK